MVNENMNMNPIVATFLSRPDVKEAEVCVLGVADLINTSSLVGGGKYSQFLCLFKNVYGRLITRFY